MAARPNAPFCVGFAAESHDVARLGEEKRKRKKLPLLSPTVRRMRWASDQNEVSESCQDALGSDEIR